MRTTFPHSCSSHKNTVSASTLAKKGPLGAVELKQILLEVKLGLFAGDEYPIFIVYTPPSVIHNLPPSLEIMIYFFYNSTYSKSIIFSSCNGTSLQIEEDFIFNFGLTGSLLLARLMWHYPFPFKRWKFVKRNFLLWRHWKFPPHILFQLCKQIFLTSFSWF